MSLREKIRKVFRRSQIQESESGIKIVYYRRSEIPPSKFKGPFDKEHQKRLAAWSFEEAQKDRPRSPNLSLSPCTTLPDYISTRDVAEAIVEARPRIAGREMSVGATPAVYHDEFIQDRQATTDSFSSNTAVDPESFSDSTMTLFLDPLEDESTTKPKGAIQNSAPIIKSIAASPLPAKGVFKPFAPEDLTRALNRAQICS
ncbi:uncharacterized protein BDV14DRAFT_94779 [Aspergillus stella-maris]|uniref:uncharacterized protein n=1 Tax=Aspergillus stella-maris TaxID=1810926 RepID=UPI003CCCB94B